MQQLKANIKKVFLFFVAMQILNTGLFAQDFSVAAPDNQNIINSVTEYIAEVILNKIDFFPEQHQQHNHGHHKNHHSLLHKVQQYVLFKHTPVATYFAISEQSINNKYVLDNNINLQEVIFDITPPPPKA